MGKRNVIGAGYGQVKKSGNPTSKRVVMRELSAKFRKRAGPVLIALGITDISQQFLQSQLHSGSGAPMQTREDAQSFCTIGLQCGMLTNEDGSFRFTDKFFRPAQSAAVQKNEPTTPVVLKRDDNVRYSEFLDTVYIHIAVTKSVRDHEIRFSFDALREWIRGTGGPGVTRNEYDRACAWGLAAGRLTRTATGYMFVSRNVRNALHVAVSKERKLLAEEVGKPRTATARDMVQTKPATPVHTGPTLSEREKDILWCVLLIEQGKPARITEVYPKFSQTYATFELAAQNVTQPELQRALEAGVAYGWLTKHWPKVPNSQVEFRWVMTALDPFFLEDLEASRAPVFSDAYVQWLRDNTGPDGLRMAALRHLVETNALGVPFATVGALHSKVRELVSAGMLCAEGNTKARRYRWLSTDASAELAATPAHEPAKEETVESLREQLDSERKNSALLRRVIEHLLGEKVTTPDSLSDLLEGLSPADVARARSLLNKAVN